MTQRQAAKWMRDYHRKTTLDCGHRKGNLPTVKVGRYTVCGEGCAKFINQQLSQQDKCLQRVAKLPR